MKVRFRAMKAVNDHLPIVASDTDGESEGLSGIDLIWEDFE